MIALSGVRSSWLMLARKVLLARLADSAASRASCSRATMRACSIEMAICELKRLSVSIRAGVKAPAVTRFSR